MNFEKTITNKLRSVKRVCWRNNDFMWVSIPKNANMNFRSICQKMGAMKQDWPRLLDRPSTIFSVWRNPRTRLVSGMGEYLARTHKKSVSHRAYSEHFKLLLADASGFDEHLEPQIVYANGVTFSHLLEFEDMINEMMRVPVLENNQSVWRSNIQPKKTQTSKHAKGTSIEDIISDNHTVIENLIEKYYAQDLEIWTNLSDYEGKHLEFISK